MCNYVENERFIKIVKVLKTLNIVRNSQQICDMIGVDRSIFSKIMNGKRQISQYYVDKLCETFPEVNAEWLLTGEGEMLKDNSQNIINSTAGRDIIQTKQEKALDEILKEKDKQLDILHQQTETLRQQIKEKDEQIKTLLNLLQKNS